MLIWDFNLYIFQINLLTLLIKHIKVAKFFFSLSMSISKHRFIKLYLKYNSKAICKSVKPKALIFTIKNHLYKMLRKG